MEIALTILGGLLGIIGAFAGAWVANRYEKREKLIQDRKDTTIALYNEYQNSEMLKARIETQYIFAQNNKVENPLPLSELRETLDIEKWLHVAMVMTFFEKLGILLENDYLDLDLSKRLLQYDFQYWHEKYFSNLIINGKQSQAQWWKAIQYVAKKWL